MFPVELCYLLGLSHPDTASVRRESNDCVFERVVKDTARDGSVFYKRIDLYKRDCFVLAAKQSRITGDKKMSDVPQLPGMESAPRGRRDNANRAWDLLMMNARAQAENYVRLQENGRLILPADIRRALNLKKV